MGSVECNKCGKSFGSDDALEQHMKDYDHSKLNECPTCGDTFASEVAYKDHRRTHMNPVRKQISRLSMTHVAVLGVAILLVGGFMYAGDFQTSPTGNAASGQSDDVNRTVRVSGGEYYFSPQTISVKKGETVKVIFTNTGRVPHNLRIPALNVGSARISPQQSDSFTFTAPESGSFPIETVCTLPGHAQRGMTGQLQHDS